MHRCVEILIRQNKHKLIKLAEDCKTAMDISEKAHIFPKDIGTIKIYWRRVLAG